MSDSSVLSRVMKPAELEHFYSCVERQLAKLGHDAVLERDRDSFALRNRPGSSYGLVNLGQVCRGIPRWRWNGEIWNHLRRVLSAESSDPKELTFEEARSRLKPRLVTLQMELPLDWLVLWPISDRFHTYLAIDNPQSVGSVHPDRLRDWELGSDDALSIALENVWREDPVNKRVSQFGEANLTLLQSESVFTSAHLLLLERHFPLVPAAGLAVAVPNRHFLLVRSLDDPSSLRAVGTMKFLAEKMYEDGPGSISREVFWWQPGRLETLDLKLQGDDLRFHPPDELLAVWG